MINEDLKTCYAEGHYASRTGKNISSNPYPYTHKFFAAWHAGFTDGLLYIRNEFQRLTAKHEKLVQDYTRMVKENESLANEMEYTEKQKAFIVNCQDFIDDGRPRLLLEDITMDYLKLSVRTRRVLDNNNIKTIGDLISKTERHMLRLNGFGRKGLNELKEVLQEIDLTFAKEAY